MRYGSMNRKSTKVALTAIMATVYPIVTVMLGDLAFAWIQVRISDALVPLSAVLGWPAIIGVTLGCVVANFFSPIGLIDYVVGPLSNLVASYIAYKVGRNKHLACLLSATVVTMMVAPYISAFYGVSLVLCIGIVFVGEFIACYVIGLPVLIAIDRVMRK